MLSRLINFLNTDIWRIRLRDLPKGRLILIRNLRIIMLALRGFNEDKCQLRASALTFYSLLSIVPMMAMAFGVAKGFGVEKLLEKQLYDKLPGQTEVLTKVVHFSQKLLVNTQGGLVAGIGIALLFWTVIKVLGNIEHSFNDIWEIKSHRSLWRKLSDYLSIALIGPFLVIIAGSTTVFLTTQITMITQKISVLGFFSPLIYLFLKYLPYCLTWMLFTFIYVIMPNTRVNFRSALMAGIVSGTIYQIVQWLYIDFQVGVAKYNAIYGTFAALPLFLIWLQLSWIIVLLGAEVSFAHQNVDTYEFEQDCHRVTPAMKRQLALRIMHLAVLQFLNKKGPLTDSSISHDLEIPIRLVHTILYDLESAQLLTSVKMKMEREHAYQIGVDPSTLTVEKVLYSLENCGVTDIPMEEGPEMENLGRILEDLNDIRKKSESNILIKDINCKDSS